MKRFFLALFAGVSILSCTSEKEKPYLVIFSFDGFRADYPDSCITPYLDSLEKTGVRSEYLKPGFPSVTFPNHYAIATGLYPGNNGLVHNEFYDKKLDKVYAISDREAVEDSVFYKGIPLWNLLRQDSIKTATLFWVGSEAPVNGMRANYWFKYNSSLSFRSRMDTVMSLLNKPEEQRPHLIMAYFSEPDHTGHDAGPFAPETDAVVEALDSLIGYFYHRLSTLPLAKNVNVIILSDHGMAKVDTTNKIILDNYIKESWIKRCKGGSTCYYIEPAESFEDSVYNCLKRANHLSVYRRENAPAEWHLNDTNRIDRFIVVAHNGYAMTMKNTQKVSLGNHGYDNKEPDMQAIFYASGPVFKVNYRQKSFDNVCVYELVANIFSIVPPKNDGRLDDVEDMLKLSIEQY